MKKMLFIIMICLLLVGCGSKKTNSSEEKSDNTKEEKITTELGSENMTFKEKTITCGNYQVQSELFLSSEKDDSGELKGSYKFYECHDDNINLQEASGIYTVDDSTAIFKDTYGETITFELSSNDIIEQKDGSDVIRTMEK